MSADRFHVEVLYRGHSNGEAEVRGFDAAVAKAVEFATENDDSNDIFVTNLDRCDGAPDSHSKDGLTSDERETIDAAVCDARRAKS